MTTADASSLNDDDDGAEEDEVAVDIKAKTREDFATGSSTIHQDNAATMIDESTHLLFRHPPPHRGFLIQRDDRTVGAKEGSGAGAP